MTVGELIDELKKLPPSLPATYPEYEAVGSGGLPCTREVRVVRAIPARCLLGQAHEVVLLSDSRVQLYNGPI